MKFSEGGMWEEREWTIEVNEPIRKSNICKHCTKMSVDNPRYDKFLSTWLCPFVVVGINEGGHNSTGICLQCILEAVDDNQILK